MADARTTKHLRVFGRVQGVGYRTWAAHTAGNMGLNGWVRNRRDGSVEALVSGEDKAVTKFISECYNGPPASQVKTVGVSEGFDDETQGFEIRETA